MTEKTLSEQLCEEIWSDEKADLAKALVAAQKELPGVGKSARAVYGSYAPLPDCMEVVRPVYNKHGIAILQLNRPATTGVMLSTILLHESGQWVKSTIFMGVEQAYNPQKMGSAETYARRYDLNAITTLCPDEDDDGNAASKPYSANKTVAKQSGGSWNPESKDAKWREGGISPKQREMLIKILSEKYNDPADVADFLFDRFGDKVQGANGGASLANLTKGEASGLMDELLGKSK